MSDEGDTVIVIDDDPSVREGLDALIRSVGLKVRAYGSVAEFLSAGPADGTSCLVLDVRLPGQGGLDFQRALASSNIHLPIVFITGHGDIPMSVQAMKGGAVEFMTKPFRDQDLLDAIHTGLERDRAHRARQQDLDDLRARHQSLSEREQEIMGLVITGLLNKQIAARVGLSEITVKVHRGSVMRKMRAKTFADLVLMGQELKASGDLT